MPKKKEASPVADSASGTHTVELPAIKIERFKLKVIGDSPLVVHKWSEKAKKQMLDKQMKVASSGKEARNPKQEYQDSIYLDADGDFAFPSVAFKSAIVSACRFTDGLKMTVLRGAVHIDGEFVKINSKPAPREDMVRVGMGTADLRYRGEYKDWTAVIDIAINTSVLSFEQVVNLLNLAGFGVGVGEWRPERNGSFGRFHVALEGE